MVISGVIGGMKVGDNCTLELTGTDSAGGSCKGDVANITASASPQSFPSQAQTSIVCNDSDGVLNNNGPIGSIQDLATVSVCGTSNIHTCAGISEYMANPAQVAVGSSISLTATATAATNTDGTPINATDTVITWSEDGTAFGTGTTASYHCATAGVHTLQIAVHDNYYLPSCTGAFCGTISDTFQVFCGDVPGSEPCQCSGTGPTGPVTVACGQTACGSDYMIYSCSDSVFTLTGQACSS